MPACMSAADRVVYAYKGPARTVSPTPTSTRNADVTTIARGSTTFRRRTVRTSPAGSPRAGTSRQKARFHTLAMAYSVSRLVATPPTTSTSARGEPSANPGPQ